MINQILVLFTGVFAIIGLLTALHAGVQALRHGKRKNSAAELTLYVKDCEESIEGEIREYASQLSSGLCGIEADALVAVDLGSKDSTPQILARLERDISILKVYTLDEYIREILSRHTQ